MRPRARACVIVRAQYVTSARFTFECGLGQGFGWNYGNIAAATDERWRGDIVRASKLLRVFGA